MIRAADLFCGAGGASTGLVRACRALGVDVELLAVPGGRLHLLLAGPECTHFSTARGGRPVNPQSRASAWHILKGALRPADQPLPTFATDGAIAVVEPFIVDAFGKGDHDTRRTSSSTRRSARSPARTASVLRSRSLCRSIRSDRTKSMLGAREQKGVSRESHPPYPVVPGDTLRDLPSAGVREGTPRVTPSQGDLFADAPRLTGLCCTFGAQTVEGTIYAPDWQGPHHCWACARHVEEMCAQFDSDVQAGKYDAAGYTPRDRRAALKRSTPEVKR